MTTAIYRVHSRSDLTAQSSAPHLVRVKSTSPVIKTSKFISYLFNTHPVVQVSAMGNSIKQAIKDVEASKHHIGDLHSVTELKTIPTNTIYKSDIPGKEDIVQEGLKTVLVVSLSKNKRFLDYNHYGYCGPVFRKRDKTGKNRGRENSRDSTNNERNDRNDRNERNERSERDRERSERRRDRSDREDRERERVREERRDRERDYRDSYGSRDRSRSRNRDESDSESSV